MYEKVVARYKAQYPKESDLVIVLLVKAYMQGASDALKQIKIK